MKNSDENNAGVEEYVMNSTEAFTEVAFASALCLVAIYQLATAVIYVSKERDRSFRFVNSLCVLCASCGAFNCAFVFVITVFVGGRSSNTCEFLKVSSVVCITLSRCLSNFFFHSRFKSLYENNSAVRELSRKKYFVLGLAIVQIAHFIIVCVFAGKCFPQVHKVVFIGIFATIFLLQTLLLLLFIELLYSHTRYSLETSGTNLKVLKRVCVCTAIFVASDLFAVVVVVFSPEVFHLSLEVCFSLSLVMNTFALKFSFVDQKQRFFPCLKS